MGSIVGRRSPVAREFNRRVKRRFQECGIEERGIEIVSSGQTILMQIPVPPDVASHAVPRRAAG
jgi:hypothetical protein